VLAREGVHADDLVAVGLEDHRQGRVGKAAIRKVAPNRERDDRVLVVDRRVGVAARLEPGLGEVRLDLVTTTKPPAAKPVGKEERVVREELGHALGIGLLSALEPFLG
jgi:hypothetical protein